MCSQHAVISWAGTETKEDLAWESQECCVSGSWMHLTESPNTWKFYCHDRDLTVGRLSARSGATFEIKKSMRLWANRVDLYGPCHAPTQGIETSLVEQEEVIFQTGWILTEFPKGQEGTMLCFPANKVEWARMKKYSRVSLSTQTS